MAMFVNAGARLDRLPISSFHYRIFALVGAGMFFDGYDLYVAGGVLAATIQTKFSTLPQNLQFLSLTFVGMTLGSLITAFATVADDNWRARFLKAATPSGGATPKNTLEAIAGIAREPWAVPMWPQGLGAILYLAIAGSVVTFVAWQWLLKEMPATSLSYIALIIPIVAVLLGASLGNETFDVTDLAGAGIVLLGIYVSTSRRAAAFARTAMEQGIADPDPIDPPPRKT